MKPSTRPSRSKRTGGGEPPGRADATENQNRSTNSAFEADRSERAGETAGRTSRSKEARRLSCSRKLPGRVGHERRSGFKRSEFQVSDAAGAGSSQKHGACQAPRGSGSPAGRASKPAVWRRKIWTGLRSQPAQLGAEQQSPGTAVIVEKWPARICAPFSGVSQAHLLYRACAFGMTRPPERP